MKPTNCRHCGRISPGHYCRDIAPGESKPCSRLARERNVKQSNARIRQQGTALNGGQPLGRGIKSLKTRLDFLTVRSYAEVAAEMGITASAVRNIEMRALSKLRAALLPFRGATSGADKVTQITKPIPSI